MTAATRSKIRYVVRWLDTWIADADDRDDAEIKMYVHANRHQRPIADYSIRVELREEAT